MASDSGHEYPGINQAMPAIKRIITVSGLIEGIVEVNFHFESGANFRKSHREIMSPVFRQVLGRVKFRIEIVAVVSQAHKMDRIQGYFAPQLAIPAVNHAFPPDGTLVVIIDFV